jgi:Flp pilus assembly protein TadD
VAVNAVPQPTPQQLFDQALRLHQAGQLSQAEQIYRQILDEQPQHPGATHYLGVITYQNGRYDVAEELIRKAIALAPTNADAHGNLDNLLRDRR